MAPAFIGSINSWIITGSLIILIFILCIAFSDKLKILFCRINKYPVGRFLMTFFIMIFSILLALAIFLSALMVSRINVRPDSNTTLIVLGCRVKGNTPSLMLTKRVTAAKNYLEENKEAFVIVSGGQGKDENISEAECMKNMLIDMGIEDYRIYTEDKSRSTDENIRFSFDIIKKNNLPINITIVTSEYHQFRAYLFAKAYFNNIYSISSHTLITYLLSSWVREWFAICYKLVFM